MSFENAFAFYAIGFIAAYMLSLSDLGIEIFPCLSPNDYATVWTVIVFLWPLALVVLFFWAMCRLVFWRRTE